MIAIETKFVPCTNTKPSRIVAFTCNGHRLMMSKSAAEHIALEKGFRDAEDSTHYAVAQALADKMDWKGRLIGGGTKSGYAWVFA